MDTHLDFASCLHVAKEFHGGLCAGIILGTRMAILGLRAVGIEDPKGADRKDLIVYVEMDRCASDAILAVTGCHPGKRSLKILDYGKMAATFVNRKTGKAVRVWAKNRDGNKVLTREEIENSPHTEEYAMMPVQELFESREVDVHLPPEDLPGRPLRIVTCEACGERVMDRREKEIEGRLLCRPCASGKNYFSEKGGAVEGSEHGGSSAPQAPSRGAGECGPQDEVLDIKTVDWDRVWQARRAKGSPRKRSARFWDGRAASFAKAASETDYADRLIAIMKPEAHWTVLDMGCGSGTLAVPLAKRVSSVTAVDFSTQMLALLRARCEAEGVRNIAAVQGQWEEDWGKLGLGAYDAAIASRSTNVDDLRSSLLKLDAAARKRVYIVTIVGDGPYDRRLFQAIGRTLHVGPDYIYTYNMLYQMGIPANVKFIEQKRRRTYRSPEEASRSMQWMFEELLPGETEKLNAYLQEKMALQSGGWVLPYDNVVRWAVIWWEKE